MGTLGVVTQLALKVKSLAERSSIVLAHCADLAAAETILARLSNLEATPAAIDLLVGPQWKPAVLTDAGGTATIAVRVEGGEAEAKWLAEHVQYEFWQGGAVGAQLLSDADADRLWTHQIEFADRGAGDKHDASPLVVKIAVPPSAVVATIAELVAHDAACTIQAHAASGIIVARFANFTNADVGQVLVGQLRPAAIRRGGSLVVLGTTLDGLTPHILWGGRTDATILMERVKREFDPHNILNPGSFVF
jgi:FAD/FMN-containing dehydrogenase